MGTKLFLYWYKWNQTGFTFISQSVNFLGAHWKSDFNSLRAWLVTSRIVQKPILVQHSAYKYSMWELEASSERTLRLYRRAGDIVCSAVRLWNGTHLHIRYCLVFLMREKEEGSSSGIYNVVMIDLPLKCQITTSK